MHSSLPHRVKEALERRRLAAPGDRLGVGVSGGADSVALLRLLHGLQDELGIRLAVLHFQHGLRGEESAGDEAFTAELAGRLGLEFFREEADVASWAKSRRANLEEAGRQLRSEFFERMVREARVTRVATAHTADDQAETVLAHLVRGTGLAGLAGIYPAAGRVVRPLLEVRRAELRAWLTAIGQAWREDSTNMDTARLRARLRRDLLPLLEREFQTSIVGQLCGLAELAREEERFGTALAEARFRALARREGSRVVLRAEDLLTPMPQELLPDGEAQTALARRLVRRAVEEVLGHRRGFTAEHVESVLHVSRGSRSGHRVVLPHGVVVRRDFDEVIFTAGNLAGGKGRLKEQGGGGFCHRVALPERGSLEVIVPAIGRRVRLKVVDCTEGAGETELSENALDAGRLTPPFLFRNWHPGDVYCPRGRRQARKLKELLREARVSASERALWPVLESGGGIVWVRGLPPAANCAASQETRSALLISEEEL
ncbi:MAG TPA: tRNA lysidine(34) synthetase TilS [Candidatus Acidoferrales bacterium]|nr:tRNA lysidine(34) synthetase TilS [Candidatus Acidoferrales bacterium]